MSGVKHTPGPWHWLVSANSDGTPDSHQIGEPALVARNGQMVCWFGDSSPYDNSSGTCPDEANARLIAAAPDMFDYILSSAKNGCATAQQIIARARGEQSPNHSDQKEVGNG